jgi:ABC-type antimicrobial peptide transport system permease subunit
MLGMGLALGLPLSFMVSRFLQSQLWKLNYLDTFSFSIAIALTLLVAIAAAFLPARRAAKVDPMVALRYE